MAFSQIPVPDGSSQQGPIWSSVALYYIVACAISWPLFWRLQVLGLPTSFFAIMWGPGIAAVATLLLFRSRHVRTITLCGGAPKKSLLFYVPMLILALVVGSTSEEIELSATSLALTIGGPFAFVLGEELGWRGFLQDALRLIPKLGRYVLIGVMWEGCGSSS